MSTNISPVLKYTFIVSMGGFIFGFDASVISGALGYVVNEFNLSTWQQGFVVSAPTLGAILATLMAGTFCDKFGRRNVLIGIAFLYLFSATASALATSYAMLMIARFIGGLAFCSLMVAPMYIAEISDAKTRGKMVSVNQLNIVIGFSAAYFSNYLLLDFSQSGSALANLLKVDSEPWRWMLGLEIIPALVYFALLFTIPKSPRWLVSKKRIDDALIMLNRLEVESKNKAQLVQNKLADIKRSINHNEPSLSVKIATLFSPNIRLALIIGLVVGIAQQVTGVNAIYFYAPSIFEQSGIGTNAAFSQAIWVGIINVIFTLVAMAFIDKLGRKPLLIIGLVGISFSMLICAYGFNQASYQLTTAHINSLELTIDAQLLAPLADTIYQSDVAFKHAVIKVIGASDFYANQSVLLQNAANINSTLVLIGILAFVASFAVSLGPVMWVLFAEIFPQNVRGVAISFVGVINSIVSFIVQTVFPWELANFGAALTFFLYAAFALISLMLIIMMLPETKGKSLEELQDALTKGA